MKPWQLGVMFAAIVIIASGSVAGIVLYVTQREDDRQAQIARDLLTANEALERAQLGACNRGNVLRARVQTLNEITSEFIGAAASARASSAAQTTDPRQAEIDAEAAATYRGLQKRIRAILPVDCVSVVSIPNVTGRG